MKQKFHPDALEEYLGAVAYYADISPKLGKSFNEKGEGWGAQVFRSYPYNTP